MFLTKMPINRRRRAAAKLLAYPEAMHAAVEAAFAPGALTSRSGRALWRVDSPAADEVSLYLVSPVEPDLSHLVEQAGWQTGQMWQCRDYSPVLESLRSGDRYSFRLRANPIHHGRSDRTQQTKPVAHVSVKHQEKWLLDRAERNGFVIPDGPESSALLTITERGVMRFGKRNSSQITIAHATFEGLLTVGDPDLLRDALTKGIGRAKAYGCGLMTLAAPTGEK